MADWLPGTWPDKGRQDDFGERRWSDEAREAYGRGCADAERARIVAIIDHFIYEQGERTKEWREPLRQLKQAIVRKGELG